MNKKFLILIVTSVVIYFGCEDIFEEDISSKEFDLFAPANNAITDAGDITFWWEEVDDATNYALQIVKPSFDAIETVVLDSSVVSNQFTYALESGSYEWRIKAYNNSSYTYSDTNSLVIQGLDISTEKVELITPSDKAEVSDTTVNFYWENVSGATGYVIRIVSPSFENIENLVANETVTSEEYSIELEEGDYEWRVKAYNDQSETYSDTSSFTVNFSEKFSH